MRSERLYKLLEANPLVIPVILVLVIIIFGGIGVYLAEHKHQGANITNLGDAFWWAIVTITTVGYGEFFPLTFVGRAIGVLVMFSGIGIVVIIVGIISQKRIKGLESMLKSKTEVRPRLFGDEKKTDIIDKIEGIEKLTEEDFDTLFIKMKSLRRTLLEESRNSYKCSRCGNVYYNKPKFCSNCGLDLSIDSENRFQP
jgi:voltage-gated potassium channel